MFVKYPLFRSASAMPSNQSAERALMKGTGLHGAGCLREQRVTHDDNGSCLQGLIPIILS